MSVPDALRQTPPIIIGATGGSGSRVLAEILREANCYIGDNLNFALDNMDFAFCLGGRVSWLRRRFPFDEIDERARADVLLFRRVFFGDRLSLGDRMRILSLLLGYLSFTNLRLVFTRSLAQRAQNMAKVVAKDDRRRSGGDYLRWGFKFPGVLFFLPLLLDVFPDMRFVHLVRDGRDMALSDNQKALEHYGALFGIEGRGAESSFELWSRMNHWAKQTCLDGMHKDNYLLVRFEDLCSRPRDEIGRMLEFCGLRVPEDHELYALPKKVSTIGRWKARPELFKELDSSSLTSFGYGP